MRGVTLQKLQLTSTPIRSQGPEEAGNSHFFMTLSREVESTRITRGLPLQAVR